MITWQPLARLSTNSCSWEFASYESVFGSLAAVIVAMAYLYISTTAFLFVAQVDAIIRAQSTGALSGIEPDSRTIPI